MATQMRIKQFSVEALIPYAKNARTHSPAQVNQIAASIEEFGFTNPVLVDGGAEIIAGHGRVLAALQLGLDKVPCIVLDHLSDAQKRAYVLADNRLALNAGWDVNLLGAELIDLGSLDFGLDVIGFTDSQLEKLGVGGGESTGANVVEIGGARNLLLIECEDEDSLAALFDEMSGRGVQCKILD